VFIEGGGVMSTRISGSLVRGAPVARAEKVRTYTVGRVCAAEGCSTVLSIYNPSRFCGLHLKPDGSRGRRRPARTMRRCVCEHCGAEFETSNPVRKYCSDRCRMAAFATRQRDLGGGGRVRSRERRHETVLPPEVLKAAGIDEDAA
jgi:hypothetical protein